jgi:hypothetical protein
MNSRERVGIAMGLAEPDRVPVFCQLAIGHYFLNAEDSATDIWFRPDAFADALVRLQRRYRFDGILRVRRRPRPATATLPLRRSPR